MPTYIVDHEMNLNGQGNRYNDISEIVNFNAPTQVEPNTPFEMSYGALNKSNQIQTLWGIVTDIDTNSPIPGSQWEELVEPSQTKTSPGTVPGRTTDFHGMITIGHVEGNGNGKNAIWGIVATLGVVGVIGLVSVPRW